MLLDERAHPHVGEPEVVPGDGGAPLLDAGHAVVQKEIETLIECEEPEYRIETAWGEGPDFGGESWAMYIVYVDP